MNYEATSDPAGKRSVPWRAMRTQGNSRNGKGYLSQSIVMPAAAIEHAGIARSVRYMVKHCCKPIRVNDLMAVARLSRRGFLKSFRKHTGRSPGAVLRLMRIEHAKRLLTARNPALAEVAAASGFRKANSFFVAFRSATGLSPMKYQTLARAEGSNRDRNIKLSGERRRYAALRRADSGELNW